MAPVFSKMRPSNAVLPTHPLSSSSGSPLSVLAKLTDDSLLIILSFFPLSHLLSQVHLTCKRMHALLPHALRQRRSLIPNNHYYPGGFNIFVSPYLLRPYHQVALPVYAAYLGQLFDRQRELYAESLFAVNSSISKNASLEISQTPHTPLLPLFFRQIDTHLPNLTHLSLIGLSSWADLVLHLLTTYRGRLQSPFLLHFGGQQNADDPLWPIIDSMISLRRLTLGYCAQDFPDFSRILPNVLPRLTRLTLRNIRQNPFPILKALNGSKLTHLHLVAENISDSFLNFFTMTPTFGRSLTHLTLTFSRDFDNGVTLSLLQTIVTRFTRLCHLDVSIKGSISIARLLPYLINLPRLTFLGLHSCSNHSQMLQIPPGQSLTPLTCLRVLNLGICIENPQMLTLLSVIFPNLEQLYLHEAFLLDNETEDEMSFAGLFMEPEDEEKFVASPERAALVAALNSLPFMPTIN